MQSIRKLINVQQNKETTRIDLQLIEMVKDARAKLKALNIDTYEKVLMSGFSASGTFVGRFSLLHPEIVKAFVAGASGAIPTLPIKEYQGHKLPYPIGIHGVKKLTGEEINVDEFKKIPCIYYIGSRDTQQKQDPLYHKDAYSRFDKDLVIKLFGPLRPARMPYAEKIYNSVGSRCKFIIDEGMSHNSSNKMRNIIQKF